MPVPGSLRRRPIDQDEIAKLLSLKFSLPKEETLAYLKLLETTDMTLDQLSSALAMPVEMMGSIVGSMVTKGLVIERTGSPKRYSPLHPRMTLTNIFKVYEK